MIVSKAALDYLFQNAVDQGVAPGIVAGVATSGGTIYEGAAGVRASGSEAAITADSVFRIFSMTKAIASIAALQLYERGLLDLDAPVETYAPAFSQLQVIDGFDGDAPRLRAPKRKATVKQLMTHTAGLAYQFWNADTKKYVEVTGNPGFLSGKKLGIMYPLTFDPGDRWHYGINTDWLGQVIEGVTGKTLREVCREQIFAPLSMRDTDFECEGAARDRLVGNHARGEDGTMSVIALDPPSHPEVYGGGYGAYSTLGDYLRFLRAMLNKGELDGVRILKPETLAYALQNHTGDLEMTKLTTVIPQVSSDAEFFPGRAKSHGLAFMTNREAIPGTLSANSHFWAGALNTYYWFDPARDVAGVILMQFLPFADKRALGTLVDFQKAVYAAG
jgi:methyl acetate hydrolase